MHFVDTNHRLALALALALAFAAAACAAPTIPNDTQVEDATEADPAPPKKKSESSTTGGDKSGGDKSGTPEGSGGQPVPTPPGGGATPAPTTCGSSATADACYQCCDPTNAFEPPAQAFGECACATPGVCKTACGTTYCAGQAPDAACEACLNGATQCEAAADAACGAACKAAIACEETSKCDEKP